MTLLNNIHNHNQILFMLIFVLLTVPSKNLCGVPVDVLGGCTGKDMMNGSSNPQNTTAMNNNAASQPIQYNPCIEGDS